MEESKSQTNSNAPENICNVNIGILGHVDSGKTSLAKVLSSIGSTAAFDKNPQSQQRGITLDLGFSAFTIDRPTNGPASEIPQKKIQFTLVDCPGHASLIRTIIGGSQIIDMMFLVIDATKGIQTQTAECIVIGEITTDSAIIILNKVDMLPKEDRQKKIEKTISALQKALSSTRFANAPFVPLAAHPSDSETPYGLENLRETLLANLRIPKRTSNGPFLFSVDHCFQIKGQGTVLTGTVLSGGIKVNQTIEIPHLKVQKKIKSMQMFRKPVDSVIQGDRVGICVTQLDTNLMERGIAAEVGSIHSISACIISAAKIRFYKSEIQSRSKFHISVGHATVMGTVLFFNFETQNFKSFLPQDKQNHWDLIGTKDMNFDFTKEYLYADKLLPSDPPKPKTQTQQSTEKTSDGKQEEDSISTDSTQEEETHRPLGSQFALIVFENAINCSMNSVVIGSKLDTDIHSNSCRIAFCGRLLSAVDHTNVQEMSKLKIFKIKRKKGDIERIHDEKTLICKNLFKKETDITPFLGMKVKRTSNGAIGVIDSSFGKSGKFKVYFSSGNQTDTNGTIILEFKRFIHDTTKKMSQ